MLLSVLVLQSQLVSAAGQPHTPAVMVAEHVELALFEQSLGDREGVHQIIAWLTPRTKPEDRFYSTYVSTAIAV
ncbi:MULTISPECIES: hypothetical protein [unclassified Mesorhizobium]|uniref:hypothetical protein n=1 Tax=unclassified Mesorhizobium TaxID=325217 RepID=UPI001677BBE0|nr:MULTISPECIES: hypothetical protein [unclassified Mesorhizobium]